MGRFHLLFLLLALVELDASQIVKKIQNSKQTLRMTEFQKRATTRQFSKLAKSIKETEKKLAKLQQKLDDIAKKQKDGEARYADTLVKIKELDKQIDNLDKDIAIRRERFIHLLVNQFAMLIALRQIDKHSQKGVIFSEYLKRYIAKKDKELENLKMSTEQSQKSKELLVIARNKFKQSITMLKNLQKLYQTKKEQSQRLLKKLATEEEVYRKRLRSIITRQNALHQTLAKLNILRKEEILEARKFEAERQAQLESRIKELDAIRAQKRRQQELARASGKRVDYSIPNLPEEKVKVKRYGSSYQQGRITRYRGPRTISPLKGAHIVKRFGNYVDPIYKMKIFNDSITLGTNGSDRTVRNVLNGKVVYIGRNSILGRVVIVQHSNGIHTVYAGLSKISPIITTGALIRKGTAVGKVRHKLIFQVTQHSRLVNPMQMISL